MNKAQKIVETALARSEVDKLLLGHRKYCYLPHGSPSPGNTDLSVLLDVLYATISKLNVERIDRSRDMLFNSALKIVRLYDGIDPILSLILHESYNRMHGEFHLGLHLDVLAHDVSETICRFQNKLMDDRTGSGFGFHNGRYDEVRRMAGIIREQGGPNIAVKAGQPYRVCQVRDKNIP